MWISAGWMMARRCSTNTCLPLWTINLAKEEELYINTNTWLIGYQDLHECFAPSLSQLGWVYRNQTWGKGTKWQDVDVYENCVLFITYTGTHELSLHHGELYLTSTWWVSIMVSCTLAPTRWVSIMVSWTWHPRGESPSWWAVPGIHEVSLHHGELYQRLERHSPSTWLHVTVIIRFDDYTLHGSKFG